MAEIPYLSGPARPNVAGVAIVQWTPLVVSDTCTPYMGATRPDKSVQVSGTFGGASVSIKGSNEADVGNPSTLTDNLGAALTFTTAGLRAIMENVRFLIPVITGGDETTNLTITLAVFTGR